MTVRSGRITRASRLRERRGRQQQRRFLAEGPQAVREALACGESPVEVFGTGAAARRHPELPRMAADAGVPWTEIGDDVVAALADSVTPQGVLAVCRFLDRPLADVLLAGSRLVLIGADVRDPGNAGTLLRCADAAGADAAVVAGTSVDPYNPKAVRASAGSLFHLPLAVDQDIDRTVAAARSAGLQVLAADGAGEVLLDDAERRGLLARPTAWLVGNEARGLSPELRALADETVAVPLYGRAESLNLAAAAAVCLYASARVQRASPSRSAAHDSTPPPARR
ncbi:MAG: RNA methyltransferase [Nocardioidaceae bacterium]|nr:RNA methyltransferase [Nocardioidaceae bacterium]MDQ3325997.1 RNA methyltransferase [Actinomycetota bacterium]